MGGLAQLEVLNAGHITEMECEEVSHTVSEVLEESPFHVEVIIGWGDGTKT